GEGGAATPAMAHRRLRAAEAFLLRAVVIGGRRAARGSTGGEQRLGQRVGKGWAAGRERPVAAAIGIGAALPGFLAPEIGQHMRVRPLRESRLRPAFVIAAM